MKLTWYGHSCFTLEAPEGTVVFDPYLEGSVPGLSRLQLAADLVLCSHEHRDHSGRDLVSLTGRAPAFSVETISTFHDPEGGALRGPDTIHILSAGGMRLAHLGDLGCELTPEQLDRLRGLDVLLIPVGGYYTIDAKQAQALAAEVKPRIVVPMHYRTDTYGYEVTSGVEGFLALRGDVVRYPGSSLEIAPDTPAQTAVLTYVP